MRHRLVNEVLYRYVILYAVSIVYSMRREIAELDDQNRYAVGGSLGCARLRAWEQGGRRQSCQLYFVQVVVEGVLVFVIIC